MSEPHQPAEKQEGCFHWLCFKTWYPFSTLRSILFISVLLGVLFLAIALIHFFVYSNSFQTKLTYSVDGKCQGSGTGTNCQVEIEVGQDVPAPILVMYTLSGAYINHRKYINSISPDQLLGKAIDMKAAERSCTPFVTNKDMNMNKSFGGATLDPNNIAYPCGFESFLTFNDTISMYNSQGSKINIDQTNLNPEFSQLFTSRQGSENDQWISVKNQHFHEWTKDQALIGKYKLWGRINEPLKKGKYNLLVNNIYHINNLRIAKGIELTHPSKMGGVIYFIPVCFAIMGLMCIGYAIFMKTQMGDYDQVVTKKEQ